MSLFKWLDQNLERALVGILLAGIVLLISANVFMRYVLNASLSWGEELTLWIFVWFVWISVSYGFQQRAHIRITLLRDLLGERGQLVLDMFVDVLVLTFLAVLTIQCIQLIMLPFVANQTSVVLGIPIPVLYASAPVGAALSMFRIVQHLIGTLRLVTHQSTGS